MTLSVVLCELSPMSSGGAATTFHPSPPFIAIIYTSSLLKHSIDPLHICFTPTEKNQPKHSSTASFPVT